MVELKMRLAKTKDNAKKRSDLKKTFKITLEDDNLIFMEFLRAR
jgi:hypothetical protein